MDRKKRVLFLHPNFPGQFKHIAQAAGDTGHDTRFICQTHYGRKLANVQRLKLKGECSHENLNNSVENIADRTLFLANQYRRGFEQLALNGWSPDVVISHSGWGCGLYVKEFWPNCNHVAYLEWWFNPQSEFFTYDEHNKDLNIIHLELSAFMKFEALHKVEIETSKFTNLNSDDHTCYEHSNYTDQEWDLLGKSSICIYLRLSLDVIYFRRKTEGKVWMYFSICSIGLQIWSWDLYELYNW